MSRIMVQVSLYRHLMDPEVSRTAGCSPADLVDAVKVPWRLLADPREVVVDTRRRGLLGALLYIL